LGPVLRSFSEAGWEGEGLQSETELNPLQHRIKITYQLLIAKANDAIPLRFQPSSPANIVGHRFRRLVRCTIDFDHELSITATEVREE
jgi:hypothetical protein